MKDMAKKDTYQLDVEIAQRDAVGYSQRDKLCISVGILTKKVPRAETRGYERGIMGARFRRGRPKRKT
jgi:hypothetical protein